MLRFAQDNLTPRLPRLRNFRAWERFQELESFFLSNIHARQTPSGDVMWTIGDADPHSDHIFEREVEIYSEEEFPEMYDDGERRSLSFDNIPAIMQFFEVNTEAEFMDMVNLRLMQLYENLGKDLERPKLAETVKKVQEANAGA